MARFLKSNKEHIGLAPDRIVFRGEKKIDDTLIHLFKYDEGSLTETEIDDLANLDKYDLKNANSWINVYGLHDERVMANFSKYLHIAPVIISEVLNTHSRPRVIEYDNCLYVSAKMASLKINDDQKVNTENIVFLLKDKQLITFQEKKGDVFNPVRERLRNNKKKLRLLGSDYLMYTLIDIIIDNYTYIISRMGEKVENLDEKLLHSTDQSVLTEISFYKSEFIYLHKTIFPCKEMVFNLKKLESEYIQDDNIVFFRELQGNINHAVDSLNNYKEILANQLNIYHTQISSRLNDIMKFLTIFSVIFIPLTFIASIYGTNFEFIPELKLTYGYPMMLLAMIVVALIMIIYFKKRKWI
ncbi:magnesium/cobalt transporter CorA [Saccharicrinis fermentans]|uniref:Magnesium transport protein CorA n=1 Tax=Saccharicrinis fermentans DSM 9555 = JCM 21142 TaxID=869213 RepID=W7Y6G7_9BACT|nr:magnesium/cobalt transporter CorA [Saccharicrinis fermentans]GAF03223.1 magnesium transport protein CorA [Saccharicrinis fermentans DSM 9555 = JCM 21142]